MYFGAYIDILRRKWGSNSYTRAIMFFSIPYSAPFEICFSKKINHIKTK